MITFNTDYKYITILNVKYLIISPTTLADPAHPKEIISIFQFNWDNIKPEYVRYSND